MTQVSNPRNLTISCLNIVFLFFMMIGTISALSAQGRNTFAVLVLTERGGQHASFTDTGLEWLKNSGEKDGFHLTEIHDTEKITKEYLTQFKVIIQLDYPPYRWTEEAEKAFIDYIENGRGGWVGFHHAALLGEFDGYKMWNWFSNFMGGIRFKNYIAKTASATAYIEDRKHPVMKGVNPHFLIPNDEFYVFDKNPRPHVKVLAHVDEDSYQPISTIKMGDHPIIWSNTNVKARNVYFLIGHSGSLFASKDFTTMFRNAILWAGSK
ncbi:ThuA domain-containing protein [Sphingobacterium sp. UGAL515B_05]|uniref:ThuA domain-containing protein n=1 Tax=Sphingobacterium sp. UGAL515B_05 TaxID=2986767 RepID=UPI002953E419|nr:ThuA domain-containing protein [Sphingobacterium sp. UGAL515B_05]WON93280.1 ThuA domain-containing protein [Sphingobacterium sp. UGAL515B_05]